MCSVAQASESFFPAPESAGAQLHKLHPTPPPSAGALAYLGSVPVGCNGGGRLLTALLMLQLPQEFAGLR